MEIENVSLKISSMEEESGNVVEKSSKTKRSKGRSSSNEKRAKKVVQRPRKRSSNEDGNEKKGIPIFTDQFLHLFRQQKSELRLLKLNSSQIIERLKLKDAEQEQIRLDNQKMRLDIEEISKKNSLLNNQIQRIEKQFEETFPEESINRNFLLSLAEHQNDQPYRNQIQEIVHHLQL